MTACSTGLELIGALTVIGFAALVTFGVCCSIAAGFGRRGDVVADVERERRRRDALAGDQLAARRQRPRHHHPASGRGA